MREATIRAARAPFPVLIEGESGSGKEVVARAVHRWVRAATGASVRSIARRSPTTWSRPNSSATRAAPSPARRPSGPGCSRRRTAARSFSTRSGSFRRVRRRSCCACCRKASPPRRREHAAPRRRPHRCRHQSASGRRSDRRTLSRRPALPARRRAHAVPPLRERASDSRCWPRTSGATPRRASGPGPRCRPTRSRRWRLRLAGQRTRAAERDRVDRGAVAGAAASGASALPRHVGAVGGAVAMHLRSRARRFRAPLHPRRARRGQRPARPGRPNQSASSTGARQDDEEVGACGIAVAAQLPISNLQKPKEL